MRLKQLLNLIETPYLHDGNYQPNHGGSVALPQPHIDEHFVELDIQLTPIEGQLASICYISRNRKSAICVVNHDERDIVATTIHFRYPDALTFRNKPHNLLHEKEIVTNQGYQRGGYASLLYRTLVANGFSIVSDDAHFDASKALWSSLAKRSGTDYVVALADTDHGYLTTKADPTKPLLYNGTNYPTHNIWGTGNSETYLALILTTKPQIILPNQPTTK